MRILDVTDDNALGQAAAALRAGSLVVVPTDTVYGLAARPDIPDAVRRIYQAKDRPAQLHLPVLAASRHQVRQLGVEFTEAASTLANRWWPGPLTMAFGFAIDSSRPEWLEDREEVAVRIPSCAFLEALLDITGVLLVTSANRHGTPTPLSAHEAAASVSPHADLVIDGGTLHDLPSTLVNVHAAVPVVERAGTIGRDDIAAALAGAA
jgi:L-threonylcarbamoyladenylate synthase